MRYGLEEIAENIQDYILGASRIPYIFYNESGDWEDYLPKYENQTTKLGQETSGCTVWASQNQIETLHKFLYKEEPNYSERFTYLNVPIEPKRGTDPQNTHETIRKHGLVDEKDLPMTDSIAEYLDTSDITGTLRARGQNWLLRHDYLHEWLWNSKDARPQNYIDILKEALKTSPIAVSVSAWNRVGDEYVSNGRVNNHYCLLYKIEDGHPYVFDSYDHSKKKLSKDHNIRRAKRIWLNKKTRPAMRLHIHILQNIIKLLTMKTNLLDVCEKYLGKDASPENLADSEVACAETVTYLLKQVYPTVPTITGTYTLYEYLKSPLNGFVRTEVPEPGAIIISPTGTGSKGTIGHVGIFDKDLLIMSNNSYGMWKGKFTKNHTLATWGERYKDKQKMPIYYFKHI